MEINIPSKKEFLASKTLRELEEVKNKQEELLQRCCNALNRGQMSLISVPNDEEIINYVKEKLGEQGWHVEVKKKEYEQTVPPKGTKVPRVSITLKFS